LLAPGREHQPGAQLLGQAGPGGRERRDLQARAPDPQQADRDRERGQQSGSPVAAAGSPAARATERASARVSAPAEVSTSPRRCPASATSASMRSSSAPAARWGVGMFVPVEVAEADGGERRTERRRPVVLRARLWTRHAGGG
jgi:hypothetical protein